MYESLCLGTQKKCPLSELTGVHINLLNFRNCPLYTGIRIKRLLRFLCLSSNNYITCLRKTAIQIKEISTVFLNSTKGKNVRRECHYI